MRCRRDPDCRCAITVETAICQSLKGRETAPEKELISARGNKLDSGRMDTKHSGRRYERPSAFLSGGGRAGVTAFILSLTKDPQGSGGSDAVTPLAVWDSASSHENQGKPLAWVFTIAKTSVLYALLGSEKRETDLEGMEQEKREEGQVSLVLEQAADRRVLLDALDALREEDRQIVLLYAAAGLKHREVARAMNLPLATELSKYNRSMKKLRKFYGMQKKMLDR